MEGELKDSKYAVFVDFGPDPYIRGFSNYEDAKRELESMKSADNFSGEFDHYLVEIKEKITVYYGD